MIKFIVVVNVDTQGLFAVKNTSTCGRIIRTLLDKGCDVNLPQQIMGWTALYCAALISNLGNLILLLYV
mgnify:FL=1